jgi:tripartite-type tricarboxylate transporter receptor subunit TctC
MSRRLFLLAAASALVAGTVDLALGQQYPTRPITLIIPWQPGGVPDTEYRVLADIVSKDLGQPVIVENKPGGVGTLGVSSMAANAKPDGYTISYIGSGVFRAPFLQKMPYDPKKDFTYIGGVGQYLFGVVVRANSPIKSWGDFVAYAKDNPNKLTYTTFGVNSVLHLAMEQIAATHGVKLKHIPSRGNNENNAALLGGHVMASADGSAWAPLVDSGDFRLLVTWGEKRTKRWPDVPTLKEVGINFSETAPFGLVGPAGMDPAIVEKIYAAFRKAMRDPRHLALLDKFDMETFELGPEEYAAWALREIERQRQIVERFAEKAPAK